MEKELNPFSNIISLSTDYLPGSIPGIVEIRMIER